jgi:hypothetical protein
MHLEEMTGIPAGWQTNSQVWFLRRVSYSQCMLFHHCSAKGKLHASLKEWGYGGRGYMGSVSMVRWHASWL